MKNILRLIVIIVSIGLIAWFVKDNLHAFGQGRVDAAGDVTFDFGDVAIGDPIFTFTNLEPGDTESHTITVHNGDTVGRVIGIKGVKTGGSGDLEKAMSIVISENGTPIYGDGSSTGSKTLADFFADSIPVNGVTLTSVNPNSSTSYEITVTFNSGSGNAYQNTSLQFDLHFGIVTDVPLACEGIKFAKVITGTAGNDHLNGTNGNDLILGLEGNNQINGGNGNDCIVVGDGNNRIQGGNGNDVITTGNGDNRINAGNGQDIVTITGAGKNIIQGGNGDDTITGGGGDDIIHGGNGKDVIHGGAGDDKLTGDNSNDQLYGDLGTDVLNGGNGKDMCIGSKKISCEL